MTSKFFFFRKSLGLKFSKKNVAQQQLSCIFKFSLFYKFKYSQFFNFLLFFGLKKSSFFIFHFLFTKFFLFKYYLNYQSKKFKNIFFNTEKKNIFKLVYFNSKKSQIITNKFFTYKMFFFLKKWKCYEFFFLPKYFWFNFIFILQHQLFLKIFLLNFCDLIDSFLKNFKKFNISSLQACTNIRFYKSLENLVNKIITYWSNSHTIVWNYQNMSIFKNNIKLMLIQNYCNKNFTFNWFYQGYQAFLNTNLYLTRGPLFLQNISPISFNFLLLWNFNKLFYWTGDISVSYPYTQKFIWSRQNVFFSKGYPYQSFRFGKRRASYLIPTSYSFRENLFVSKTASFAKPTSPFCNFIANNKTKNFTLVLFNNCFFYNYSIYPF